MGGILSSAAAILGGIHMEEVYHSWEGKHSLLKRGQVVYKGIRVQDDTKILIGYDGERVTKKEADEVFEDCLAKHLYPPPFAITCDDRNRYLETVSIRTPVLIMYEHYNKNRAAKQAGEATHKIGCTVGTYCQQRTLAATAISHLVRVRGNCSLRCDAIKAALFKLQDLEGEEAGFSRRELWHMVQRKAEREGLRDDFWRQLLRAYEQTL
jgi:hypothetical protein